MNVVLRTALALCLLAVPGARAAGADMEVEEDAPAHPFTRSVGLSPFFFLGQLYANYEHLLVHRHGLMAEGGYVFAGPSAGSWSGTLGYRYHFSPGLEGLFVGAFVRAGAIAAEVEVKNEGKTFDYEVESPLAAAGANIGYRWQWGNGVALDLRGGYGYPFWTDLEWSPNDGENEEFKDIFELMLGLDAAITLGYSF